MFAISMACAARGMGRCERSRLSASIIGVSTAPGQMQLTRMPSGASSRAAERVAPRSPYLDDEYGRTSAYPRNAAMEATLTMALPEGITGDTACIPRIGPTRLTSSTSRI